jgi:peptidyl-prolyl cis-trans isomerase C
MENKVLAVVNGQEITEQDLQMTAMRFPRERQGFLATEEGRQQLLDQMISFELMYIDAKENGMENDENYLMQLEMAKKEILIQSAISKIMTEVVVTDSEVEDYYKANENLFLNQETVSAKHILVDTAEKAAEIMEEIAKGKSFEDAAAEYSSCPSSEQGGTLGAFSRGQMVPEFEDAAFAMEIGKVSEPVQTQFGYHLIKVEEKNVGSVKPFAEVRESIKNMLLQERQAFKFSQTVNSLKDKIKVEIK